MTTITSSSSARIQGDLDVARALYDSAAFPESVSASKAIYKEAHDPELRIRALLLASAGESEQRRYASALKTLQLADALLDEAKPKWKANYFCQRAHVKVKLSPKVVDCGVIDYQEAIYYARQADEPQVEARARNNLARRHSKADRFDEAIREVDLAIQIAKRLGEQVELGRFYDQRAKILCDHLHYADSLVWSERAIRLLADHPALTEARTTHGRTLVALGGCYLEQDEPVDTFREKRIAAKYLNVTLDGNLIQLALDRTGGNVYQAAELLQIKHPSLIQAIKKHGLNREPARRRGKALIGKINPTKSV